MKDFIRDQAGRYRFRIKDNAGNLLATSEGYISLAMAEVGYSNMVGVNVADFIRAVIFWGDIPETVDVPGVEPSK